MEADGPAKTKTSEHTEGAATAVQAMHGDSCSADRVNPDPMCSTSFGDDCTGPPAPLCSGENALVDNGAAAPKFCLPSLKMRSPTAAGGLLPTGEASIATMTTDNQPPLRLYSTKETNSKTNVRTPILPVSYDTTAPCLLPHPAGGSSRPNQEKKECSTQAVFKIVSAPAWDRGARCFVGRFMLGLDEAAAFFGGSIIGASTCRRVVPADYVRRTYSGQSPALRS